MEWMCVIQTDIDTDIDNQTWIERSGRSVCMQLFTLQTQSNMNRKVWKVSLQCKHNQTWIERSGRSESAHSCLQTQSNMNRKVWKVRVCTQLFSLQTQPNMNRKVWKVSLHAAVCKHNQTWIERSGRSVCTQLFTLQTQPNMNQYTCITNWALFLFFFLGVGNTDLLVCLAWESLTS